MIVLSQGAEDLARARQKLGRASRLIDGALVRAINRTVDGARTEAARLLSQALTLRQKDVRPNLQVRRAWAQNPRAELIISGKPPLLSLYAHTPRRPRPQRGVRVADRKPISVQVRRDRAMRPIRRSFLLPTRNGPQLARRLGRGRWNIKIMRGPSAAMYLQGGEMGAELRRRTLQRLENNYAHEVRRSLNEVSA